jgi:hypothetical protein
LLDRGFQGHCGRCQRRMGLPGSRLAVIVAQGSIKGPINSIGK